MTVVSTGQKDRGAVKLATCPHCASILEYTGGDVKSVSVPDISGSSDEAYWIDCPDCHGQVPLIKWQWMR